MCRSTERPSLEKTLAHARIYSQRLPHAHRRWVEIRPKLVFIMAVWLSLVTTIKIFALSKYV